MRGGKNQKKFRRRRQRRGRGRAPSEGLEGGTLIIVLLSVSEYTVGIAPLMPTLSTGHTVVLFDIQQTWHFVISVRIGQRDSILPESGPLRGLLV